MVSSYSGYYTGLSSRISGFDSPRDRQVLSGCRIMVVDESWILEAQVRFLPPRPILTRFGVMVAHVLKGYPV